MLVRWDEYFPLDFAVYILTNIGNEKIIFHLLHTFRAKDTLAH